MRSRRKRIRTIPGREPLTDSDKRPADGSRNALARFQHAKLRPRYGYCRDETRATEIKKRSDFSQHARARARERYPRYVTRYFR